MNFTILTYEILESTNTEALNQARAGAAEGVCIVARQQTAGRGRHGRPWVSERDAGLYFSIVLRPKLQTKYLTLMTLMAGVAVHEVVAGLGLEPDIKWVNDIHVGGKKICGILAETTDTPGGLAVVVGIGVNLKPPSFAADVDASAISIGELTGTAMTPDQITELLTKSIDKYYAMLHGSEGPAAIIDEWRRRSTYFSGKQVRVRLEGETIDGVTDGLEENGALRVTVRDGSTTIVQAGDVEQLRAVH